MSSQGHKPSGGAPRNTGNDAERQPPRILSDREIEVLELIVQGYSAREVAEHLSLSARTVERHLDNVRSKLRARNRPHLVRQAIELGEIRIQNRAKK